MAVAIDVVAARRVDGSTWGVEPSESRRASVGLTQRRMDRGDGWHSIQRRSLSALRSLPGVECVDETTCEVD